MHSLKTFSLSSLGNCLTLTELHCLPLEQFIKQKNAEKQKHRAIITLKQEMKLGHD